MSVKILKGIFLLLLITVVFFIIIGFLPYPQAIQGNNPWRKSANQHALIIGHGGAKHLMPPNTMLAFDTAVGIGIDVLETDVCLTKDGQLVTHHDLTIERLSDSAGAIHDFTYEQLLDFNFAYGFRDLDHNFSYRTKPVKIPLLDEVLAKYKEDVRFIIEIKNKQALGKQAADELVRLIKRNGLTGKVIIATFHNEVFDYLLENYPEQAYSPAFGESLKFLIMTKLHLNGLYHPKVVALHLMDKYEVPVLGMLNLASERIIEAAHQHNIALHYWTINDKETMKELIEANADGIMTDRPDLMVEVLKEIK